MEETKETERLASIESFFIAELTKIPLGIREGEVMTMGPIPYRRFDCDGRALVYLRRRPRKAFLRVDVSGLWLSPRTSRLKIASAAGVASLALRTEADCVEAAELIRSSVMRTRAERVRRAAVKAEVAAPRVELAVIPRDPPDDGETPTDRAA